jgi:protein-disulfide isomerase
LHRTIEIIENQRGVALIIPTRTPEHPMTNSSSLIRRTLTCSLFLLAFSIAAAIAQTTRPVSPVTWQAVLTSPRATPTVGAAKGDVTIVEYFDYNCPDCRALDPKVRQLLASDASVRVIRKDWPVFGDVSEYAAYCSYAAAREGKYQTAHDALIGSKQDLDKKEDVRNVMRAAGFDMKKIDADIAQHEKEYSAIISADEHETEVLGLKGTPGVVINGKGVSGSIDYARLTSLVAAARQR